MELQEYIQLELRYNSNINEGLLGGNGIFGIFSAFFHKAGDKKNDDPIAEAMKTAQEQRQAAIEDKIKSTQDELKRALAEKIKAHSQEEINRITIEKNKKVEALKSVQARYKREQAFWKNNKQALTMDQRMSMLKKTDDMLDGIRKSASPEEMDNASRLAAIMHKYALKPDGTPWKDDEEFQNALDADGGKKRKEIEEAHKAAGRTFKIDDNTKLSNLFRDVYDETAPNVQTEGEAETLADQRADFDDKKQDAIAYLDAKEARKNAQAEFDEAEREAKEEKNKTFQERFSEIARMDGMIPTDEDGHPIIDGTDGALAKIGAKWKQTYGVELPDEVKDALKGANGGDLLKGEATFEDTLSGEALTKFKEHTGEDGEQTKAFNKTVDNKVALARAKLDKTSDPDKTTDSRINRGKDLVEKNSEWSTKEAINAADEALKTKEKEVKDIQNKRESAIKAAQEQQKIAVEQLKSDKEAKDDPKLAEKIKDLTAGCETGDTIGKNDKGKLVPGYYDEDGKFIPKPEIEPGDEEGLKKYTQERDAVLMKTNGDAKGQDVVKDWSKNNDGTYSVTYIDKDGNEQTKNKSMEELAVMRAQHNSRAETQAYVDKVKSATRDELSKIELDKDGKPKLTDEEKKKLSSTTQDVLKKLEDANGDSKKIEEILKDIEGDAAGDKKLKALGDAFKKSESSSEDTNTTDDEDDVMDGDERTDNDDDLEDESENEEDKKKQDPHKVWKQRTYKRGKKTFKTKSFYNKKGDAITRKEFNEKVNTWKSTQESLTLHDYIKMIFG